MPRLQLSLLALAPTLLFTRLGIALANVVPQPVFNKILLVTFYRMEIKLIVNVI